ncbi:Uma2 family endonuclease [Methylobacterium sp. E-016]|uniref:Uma2 family endonuclease n=1 Tax=unclassified Methylobacterium TaxID=2615210 RepID=UPI0011CCA3B6|nr:MULTISPECIES: Uma2 family endonuclease [unclassified Methylobacterium]MCJ2077272.1 Uma2 family endonuclease [Methylobacterium sp. E-016]TXM88382.1 Uma2 family endonuclease [Methylobacterium sp. WL116]
MSAAQATLRVFTITADSGMLDRRLEPMSIDAFFAWQEAQAERYELVGGVPVRMMAGARNVHDDIVVNILAWLRTALRGSGCRPFTGDGSVETLPGQIRRPDIGIDCGSRDPNALKAAQPRLVVEVLSPSTRDFDAFEKLGEYRTMADLEHILLVEPNAAELRLWTRDPDRHWAETRLLGLDATVPLLAFGIAMPAAEIYDGVAFPSRPRLVPGEPGGSAG